MRQSAFWREGYRPFFVAFPLLGVLVLGAWVLALRGGLAITPVDHAAGMTWGVLGSAVLGFLLTAYPRQNGAEPPSRRGLALALTAQLGAVGALLGSWAGLPVAGLATVLGAAVWGGALVWAARIALPSLRKKWDPTTAAVPVALLAALAGWLLARAGPEPRLGLALGLHPFLIGLALSLLDRLLPFFMSKAIPGYRGRRAPYFVGPLLGLLALRALWPAAAFAADLSVVLVLLRQAVAWRVDQGIGKPMVAVLLLGVGWMILGYALDAILGPSSLTTHLLTVGGLTTLVFGIATRVARGHGGLPIALDRPAALALVLVQAAALLRALLALVVQLPATLQLTTSAALLGAAFLLWWARHAPLAFRAPEPG